MLISSETWWLLAGASKMLINIKKKKKSIKYDHTLHGMKYFTFAKKVL